MTFKFKTIVVPTLTAVAISLIGCSGKGNAAPAVTSLKTGLLNICLGNNYTFTYNQEKTSSVVLVDHDMIFLPNSIGTISSKKTVDTIFYKDGSGLVYSIGHNGKAFVGSEYYTTSSNLWNDTLVYSMYMDGYSYLNSLKDDITTLKITDKEYKMAFLETFGYSRDDLLNLDSLTASYIPYNDGYGVEFQMVYKKALFTYTAHSFGTSTNSVLEFFISTGKGPLNLTGNLKTIKDYMKGNNYTRAMYQFGEEQSGYVGYEVFNPQYYYTFYGSTLTSCSGVIAYNSSYPKHEQGTYYFVLNINQGQAEYSESSYKAYEKPDVVEMYHYPSYLNLLSHMEYLRDWDDEYISEAEWKPGKNSYLLTDSQLLADFADNFSITSSYEGCTPYCLGVDYIKGDTSSEDVLYFLFKFVYESNFYILPLPFFNFGTSNNSVLEYVLSLSK